MRSIWTGVLVVAACAANTAAVGAEFAVDPVHSTAIFKVKHMGASYTYGHFTDVAGTISFDPAKPNASAVEVTIKAESITTHNEMRDRHLKGPDFLNTREFPTLSFKSTEWKKTGDATYDVTGELVIAGKSKTITARVEHTGDGKDPRGNELSGFHTKFTIDRTEFGMNYGVVEGGGVGKDVEITVSVEGIKKK